MPTERWDCHKHRHELKVSRARTVYHPEPGQLCQWVQHWDANIYLPIVFNSAHDARKWMEEGCIADLQESLGNLHVGFIPGTILDRRQ